MDPTTEHGGEDWLIWFQLSLLNVDVHDTLSHCLSFLILTFFFPFLAQSFLT